MRRVQRVVDATFWPLLFGGCRTGVDTRTAITAAGFAITDVDRFTFPETRFPQPSATHILGTAVRGAQCSSAGATGRRTVSVLPPSRDS
ncbi:hypothetical protein [Streptomyces sp. NPDC002845]